MSRRFAFGRNWQNYAARLPASAIEQAERSLIVMLGKDAVAGKSFLDIGSGSGIHSLAAYRLGAGRIHSFDYDGDSVACTRAMKRQFAPEAANWTIGSGDVLDGSYLATLGEWDVVYSWGVLHHTGAMWDALANAARRVAPGGALYIALYNDQGALSRWWRAVKRFYVGAPRLVQEILNGAFFAVFAGVLFLADIVRLRNPLKRHDGTELRGMTLYTDVVDWIGGYPFEVATPAAVVAFLEERGFEANQLVSVGFRQGCNEFVFRSAGEVVRRSASDEHHVLLST